ncbi:hypothetical protein GCM10007886_20650 [Methylobacterium gregans]|nr:hypothetical protein GCM10007886_20650 [Methylobacterium gregans]
MVAVRAAGRSHAVQRAGEGGTICDRLCQGARSSPELRCRPVLTAVKGYALATAPFG